MRYLLHLETGRNCFLLLSQPYSVAKTNLNCELSATVLVDYISLSERNVVSPNGSTRWAAEKACFFISLCICIAGNLLDETRQFYCLRIRQISFHVFAPSLFETVTVVRIIGCV